MGAKAFILAGMAAMALLSTPASGQGAPPEPAAAHLAQAMNAHTTGLAGAGYALAAGPLVGSAGRQGEIQVRLWARQDYVLASACEAQCGAFALRVIDPNGAVLGETDNSTAPSLNIRPQVTGRYTLQARMPECDAPRCWFAINVYAR